MEEQQLGREEILSMAKLAGLHLPASYEDELVEAYGHIRRLVAFLPQPRSRNDEPAHIFDPAKFSSTAG
jgi:hypothetical protein